MPHEITLGKNKRMSYSKIKEPLDMPNLIEIQKKSYDWFLEAGLKEVFEDVSPICDYTGNLVLEFIDYKLDPEPKYPVEECKERDANYSAPLRVKVRLINKETGEVKEQDIFMGEFPLMTEQGTFIINGAERVVVSQLVRSPGMYYGMEHDKSGKELYNATIIPYRGAWLEYDIDVNDVFSVRIDRTRKLPVTMLLRAMGVETNAQIYEMFGDDERIAATLEKDNTNRDEALIEIYKKLRPGEPANVESATSLIMNMFFDPKRYDLAKVGRFKYNQKMAIGARIKGQKLAHDVVDPQTGEILASAGDVLSADTAMQIQHAGVNRVVVLVDDKEVVIFSNGMVELANYVSIDADELKEMGFHTTVRKSVLDEILATLEEEGKDGAEDLKAALLARRDDLMPKHIVVEDMFASVNYFNNLCHGIGSLDDIDHLGNRRLRCVGELLQNQFRIGLSRMERVVRERMNIQDLDVVTPQTLINIRPVASTIKEFFGSSQLSQFMDQTNPLAELTHKRRLSALGPGGLSRERAGFEVRDVHYTHYGRMCPIESPEGPNIGLISSLSSFARINEYGFIESPYRKVDKETGTVLDEVVYMTADVEDGYTIAQANEPLDENNRFIDKKITARRLRDFVEVPPSEIDYMDVSPRQLVSVATSMIPFLENDDANRALMGSNMQRQAVPLIRTESPIVGTGMEYKAAKDSGVVVLAKRDGVIEKVSAKEIVVKGEDGVRDTHKLQKFVRSNQGTCINQRPIVSEGEAVKKGDIIADGPSTSNGEISLGKNVLIGFMTWEGYNYEDAVLLNERLVRDDVYTSIHIEEYEADARDTKLGPEEITRDIPNVGEDALRDLDERGIIRIGAEVRSGDILVGKVTPKGETELTAEERLLRAIFGEKAREVRDTSLRVPHGEAGVIVDVKIFTRENGDELAPGVNQLVRCYIAQRRKISVGDKMAGRHGNKGVISRILPEEDMPFLPDGTPLDIVLNPLGVPSRMNIGQVLEVHLGYAAKALGWKIATPVFDGANEDDIAEALVKAGYDADGKTVLYDGRTGEPFDNRVTVGYMYYLKLHHLVDDKIHARSTGPYSLVTQQPLGGKAQFGGQRFGEMEVWALEAYGAAYTLQEILTVKSDDVVGRVKTYESIVKGENVPEPGVPESFKVLIKELQSLALDIKVLDSDGEEVELGEYAEEEEYVAPLSVNIEGSEDDATHNAASSSVYSDESADFDEESAFEFEEADDDDLVELDDDIVDDLDDLDDLDEIVNEVVEPVDDFDEIEDIIEDLDALDDDDEE